jgi:hypothetical protein
MCKKICKKCIFFSEKSSHPKQFFGFALKIRHIKFQNLFKKMKKGVQLLCKGAKKTGIFEFFFRKNHHTLSSFSDLQLKYDTHDPLQN